MNSKTSYFVKFINAIIGFSLLIYASMGFAEATTLADPLEAGWKGKPVCERLFEDTAKRILRCTFPPNVGHKPHYHVAHFGYALSGGRVQITDGNGVREVTLATDSSYSSDGVPWHHILNIGKTTIVYLIVESKA